MLSSSSVLSTTSRSRGKIYLVCTTAIFFLHHNQAEASWSEGARLPLADDGSEENHAGATRLRPKRDHSDLDQDDSSSAVSSGYYDDSAIRKDPADLDLTEGSGFDGLPEEDSIVDARRLAYDEQQKIESARVSILWR